MQDRILVALLFSVAFTEGIFFSCKFCRLTSRISKVNFIYFTAGPKCPIKKYKSNKYIIGDPLLLHEDFHDRVKPLENVAKDCKVRLYIRGSYYQLQNPSQQVLVSDADRVIGHGFRFELRDEKNGVLCNKICLSKGMIMMKISFP